MAVNSFSSGNLAPIFTTTVTDPTGDPVLSFDLTDASPYTVFGNNTNAGADPAYFAPSLASALFANQGTATTVLHGNASGNPSWSAINLANDITGVLPIANGGTGSTAGAIVNQTASPQTAGFSITGNGTLGGTLAVTTKANIGSPSGTTGALNTNQDGIWSFRNGDANRYIRFNTSGTFNDFLSTGVPLVINYGFAVTAQNVNFFGGSTAHAGIVSIGSNTATNTRLNVKGSTANSSAFSLRLFDSSDVEKFSVRNDGLATFAGNLVTSKNIYIPATSATDGAIYQDGIRFIHSYTYDPSYGQSVYIGSGAGNYTSTSYQNIGIGTQALQSITSGFSNNAIGTRVGVNLTAGIENTLMGEDTGQQLTTGSDNTFLGYFSGGVVTTGSGNTLIGGRAGYGLQTGSGNTIIGYNATVSAGLTNNIILANGSDLSYGVAGIKAQHDGTNWTFTGGATITGLGTGLVKATSGALSIATAGTDYVIPSALSSYLPITGGTLTGGLIGTSAVFSGTGYFGGTVKIAGTAVRATTEGTNHLDIFDGTAPAGTLANGISLYSTAGELRVMDAAGNATLLSPHERKTNYWIYDSVDTTTGKHLRIDMERMMKFLNNHFGTDFVKEFMEE